MIRFAVIADPHVHDCRWIPSGSGLAGAIRSFGETGQSTRVFNESVPAFRAALSAAVEAGARLVLLVGDLTDDGQQPNVDAALAVVDEFRTRHGLRLLATPGNHDFFALHGRPQRKTFLAADGASVVVDSGKSPEAITLGTPAALASLSRLGFVPEATDRHWETPFGTDPAWQSRTYPVPSPQGRVECRMIDASYLVEPVEGLWVLSIDANVCIPRDDASDFANPDHFLDPGKSGWDAVARHRPHLLPWIADVASRARRLGKHLVGFSHYPPLDVLGDSAAREIAMLGPSGLAQRMPDPAIAQTLAGTGLALHFSGHLHVNDTARHASETGGFVNIAVPSPVGYGAALKIVDLTPEATQVRTLPLRRAAGYDLAFKAYHAEAAREGKAQPPASMAADYGQFLDRYLQHLIPERYLEREWPADVVDYVRKSNVSDLLTLLGIDLAPPQDFALTQLAEDWYRLRKGGELALVDIAAPRLALYRALVGADRPAPQTGLAARMATVLDLLLIYLNRLPNGDFTILPSGEIAAAL